MFSYGQIRELIGFTQSDYPSLRLNDSFIFKTRKVIKLNMIQLNRCTGQHNFEDITKLCLR